jgi:transposase-like protein
MMEAFLSSSMPLSIKGTVKNRAVYLALGVLPDETKDILGISIEQSEGAKF